MNREPLLSVDDLSIGFRDDRGGLAPAVRDFRLDLSAGEVVALIGESGSGKTMVARSIPRLLPPAAVARGSIRFDGLDMLAADEKELRAVRGRDIGFVFQEPLVALNPAMTIGAQLDEGLALEPDLAPEARRARILAMLERLRVPDPARRLGQYPYEFSGGMRQRIVIASAMLRRPALLIADEPTTALDALIQGEVLALMIELAREAGAAVLLITHDLGVVADVAERVLVMRRGETVESGAAAEVLKTPSHSYTRRLLESLPRPVTDDRAAGDAESLVRIEQARVTFGGRSGFLRRAEPSFTAVKDVTLEIRRGETFAIVGESGSGKTTIARALLGLTPLAGGRMWFDGIDVSSADRAERTLLRRRMQLVFQDPFSSLDPRMRILDSVGEGLPELRAAERRRRSLEMLERVGLDDSHAGRYPHELSGGQRQRVCIARALAMEPELVVADEAVSALDLTVQAQVLALLRDLQRERRFTLVFISHDLAVVGEIADRILVMCAGHPLECGTTSDIFRSPLHPYTRSLLEASSYLEATEGEHRYEFHRRRPDTAVDVPAAPYPADADPAPPRQMLEVRPGHFVAVAGPPPVQEVIDHV